MGPRHPERHTQPVSVRRRRTVNASERRHGFYNRTFVTFLSAQKKETCCELIRGQTTLRPHEDGELIIYSESSSEHVPQTKTDSNAALLGTTLSCG